MSYKIYPILLGVLHGAEKSGFTYRTDCGTKIDCAYMCFLVQGNGHNIMVDSGTPNPKLAQSMPYPKLSDAKYLADELAKLGVDGKDIDTVILTHLHWDHCFNLELFPNARIYVQKKELQSAVNPSRIEQYAYVIKKEWGNAGWLTGFPQMTRIDGDFDLYDGIKLLHTPGHAAGQMSVLVDTEKGQYVIVGDTIPLYENLERYIVNGITIDFEAEFSSMDKIKALGAEIIPGHDIKVMEHKCFG